MKILTSCEKCGGETAVIYKCDTCGKSLYDEYFGIPITISFSYGHPLDGEEYHFCNSECTIPFLINEARKENPTNIRPDIEFGKEN